MYQIFLRKGEYLLNLLLQRSTYICDNSGSRYFLVGLLLDMRNTIIVTVLLFIAVVAASIYYFSDSIRHLIGAIDRETRKPRKFIIRRDPRNIRHVWVYDDEMKCYHKVALADPTLHFTSVWELNEAKAYLKQRGESDYNQEMLSRAIQNMNEIQEQAAKATKDARRRAQQKKNHESKVSPATHFENGEKDQPTSTTPSESPEADDWGDDDDVVIFDIE